MPGNAPFTSSPSFASLAFRKYITVAKPPAPTIPKVAQVTGYSMHLRRKYTRARAETEGGGVYYKQFTVCTEAKQTKCTTCNCSHRGSIVFVGIRVSRRKGPYEWNACPNKRGRRP